MTTLADFLTSKGIQFSSAEDTGIVYLNGIALTPTQLQQLSDAVQEYLNPVAYASMIATRNRFTAAKTTAKNIPNWATWTQAQWQTFYAANLSQTEIDLVTTLAAVRVMNARQNQVIDKLTQMVLAIRDRVMPDLPE